MAGAVAAPAAVHADAAAPAPSRRELAMGGDAGRVDVGRRGTARARRLRRLLAAAALGTTGLLAAAPVTSGASAVTKTVVTWAEAPGAAPNYIFPYLTLAYFSVANSEYFQYLMYRPLYWFGKGHSVTLIPSLSLAKTPTFTNGDKTAAITLKTYAWSDGEKVSATDVLFWLNIWHQKPTGYAGWFPGGLSMPTSIKKVTVTGPTRLTITFDRAFNPHWLLYNELSQITPLPLAWTKTSATQAPGTAGCAKAAYGSDDAACKAVYVFLSEQSGFDPTKPKTTINALPTYATDPLWQVVDGPWRLKSFGPTAPVVMVPNKDYSGPVKPTYKEFVEKPFTTASAEYNALVGGTIDFGYLPSTDVTADATAPTRPTQTVKPGKNNPRLAASFDLVPAYRWGINYLPENFDSTGDGGQAGAIFKQLYVRQALQLLINQPLYIDRLMKGYGVPTYGPVPVWPRNPYASKFEATNPYTYDPAKAASLLRSHGWKVSPGGVSTCTKPGAGAGHCGPGIKSGAKLAFTLQYASGTKALGHEMAAEKASWATAGIRVSLSSATFDTVIGNAVPCPSGCAWELENWGGGWIFSPDYYPTGEEIFAGGAGSNSGNFTTATDNELIKQTDTSKARLTKYENLLAKKLPVIWEPEVVTVFEVHKGLEGATPSPLQSITPAYWHWSS